MIVFPNEYPKQARQLVEQEEKDIEILSQNSNSEDDEVNEEIKSYHDLVGQVKPLLASLNQQTQTLREEVKKYSPEILLFYDRMLKVKLFEWPALSNTPLNELVCQLGFIMMLVEDLKGINTPLANSFSGNLIKLHKLVKNNQQIILDGEISTKRKCTLENGAKVMSAKKAKTNDELFSGDDTMDTASDVVSPGYQSVLSIWSESSDQEREQDTDSQQFQLANLK
jgi:hypothetical protein